MPRKRRRLSGAATGPEAKRAIRRRTRRNRSEDRSPKLLAFEETGDVAVPHFSGPQTGAFRAGEYLHVSDLIHKCLRSITLSDSLSVPMPDQTHFPSQGLTFAQGHAIGDFMVDRTQQKSPSTLYGHFECRCGHLRETGIWSKIRRRGVECTLCGQTATKYAEVTLVNEELKLVGNVDLMLDVDEYLHLTELKSIAGHRWLELERPVPDHKVQILIYWWMARELGMPLHDKVSIVYANKAFLIGSPYKEFVIQPSLELSYIEDYLEDARAYGEYKNSGKQPPRIVCAEQSAPAAKKCHVCTQCFNT